tara:strand:- start:311 stop:469 length:159 start_codon:yes stop_codon:yes gene_type:complete
MTDRATYWAYINNNYKWHAWYYLDGEVTIKLGPFNKQEEAQEAVEQYENSNK